MKKQLALIMIIMMVMSSMAFAAPSDVIGTNYETAVDRLMSLGIITGYTDGSFKPMASITRAEFAAIVVRSLGAESAANVSMTTRYKDVPSTHWASGYISAATNLGVINGYTTGNFGPGDPVTYEQAVAMVVRALGYEPVVAAKGGYFAGHLLIAAENNLLDGVTLSMGKPAPRGAVAILLNNALETPLMIQVSFGTTSQHVVSGMNGTSVQTLLVNKLGLTSSEKVITSVSKTGEVLFENDNKVYKMATGVVLQSGLEHMSLTVLTKGQLIYMVTVNSKIVYDFIDGDQHSATEVTLKNADTSYSVKTGAVSTMDSGNPQTPAFVGSAYDNSYGRFIIDSNNQIVRGTMVSDLDKQGFIKSIKDTSIQYTNTNSPVGASVSLMDMDNATFDFVSIDGLNGQYKDLVAGMFMAYAIHSDGSFSIAASTERITGKYDAIRSDLKEITISGKTYALSSELRFSADGLKTITAVAAASDLESLEGSVINGYTDRNNEIVFINGNVSDSNQSFYGILKDANRFNDAIKVEKLVGNKISLVTYSVDLTVDDAQFASSHYATPYDGSLDSSDFYQFVVDSNGVVTKIIKVEGITFGGATTTIDSVDAKSNSILANNLSRYFVDNDLLILSIDGGTVATHTWTELKNSSITDGSITVRMPLNDSTPAVMLILDDANSEIGTMDGDYILGYATASPTLTGGLFKGTVRTLKRQLICSDR
jgi:hypothetical protein